ncbi:MAG: uracil-DNA glycosylase [Sphingobacteriales bacterium]|nr:uracil-DNA glycosylase [Sphingobacteriales bacterium]
MTLKLEESWKEVLYPEFEKEYMKRLREFLQKEQASAHVLYPPNALIFNAFEHTPFEKVKVVILGQDPYHGPGQAHGLSFSVQKGTPFPPSLQNIFKELKIDIPEYKYPTTGDLTPWADQGVLLLNATLTVEANKPGSHQKLGWEKFTDKVIEELSNRKSGIVFLLWGKYAQAKGELIDSNKHFILKAPHPSPFSAHSGFFGCKHFSKTNEILEKQGLEPIDWQI